MSGDPIEISRRSENFETLIIQVTCPKADGGESLSRDNFFLFLQYFLHETSLLNLFLQMDFNYSIILSTQILPFWKFWNSRSFAYMLNIIFKQAYLVLEKLASNNLWLSCLFVLRLPLIRVYIHWNRVCNWSQCSLK